MNNFKTNSLLKKKVSELSLEEETKLFLIFFNPIKSAIKKAICKFDNISLEQQKLLPYAWMLFDNSLKSYDSNKTVLEFVLSITHLVELKSIEFFEKYISISKTMLQINETIIDNQEGTEQISSYLKGINNLITKDKIIYFINDFEDKFILPILQIFKKSSSKKEEKIIFDNSINQNKIELKPKNSTNQNQLEVSESLDE
ncbi:hypothetical protein MFERI14815_00704 [Mycoplasma feriruminatoris]|uniref:hypothetical protein n=1 Tax=Mycoplasma feriruminatoris TaxID=1179777 RepID=UPI00241D7316|nr:hypothetical protein [Mycoplasma feriruminatoris]WFQ92087.1 hypothetical protein MFERI14815_00704 [Mycoplasma feriruminatoris]